MYYVAIAFMANLIKDGTDKMFFDRGADDVRKKKLEAQVVGIRNTCWFCVGTILNILFSFTPKGHEILDSPCTLEYALI